MTLEAIGVFKSTQLEPYQAGRQPDKLGLLGKIKLNKGKNFEQALQDLDSCSHLWIIFGFHLNQNWKPLVQAPRANKKIGVFATRSPYRPNPLGLSLVELIRIKDLTLEIGANDILNDSPIYDLKPFHPEYDAARGARIGWLDKSTLKKRLISFSPFAETQLSFLEIKGLNEIRTFIIRQLEYDPTNKNKKRVEKHPHFWTLSYRTWRIDFTFSEDNIGILSLRSGYTQQELLEFEDIYADKKLHRLFNNKFK